MRMQCPRGLCTRTCRSPVTSPRPIVVLRLSVMFISRSARRCRAALAAYLPPCRSNAALPSDARTVGASGSVSGVIVALSVLRPTSAVHILGDVNASNPLLLLLGTLGADLSRGGVSWQAHLGGGAAGCVLAWLLTLVG